MMNIYSLTSIFQKSNAGLIKEQKILYLFKNRIHQAFIYAGIHVIRHFVKRFILNLGSAIY